MHSEKLSWLITFGGILLTALSLFYLWRRHRNNKESTQQQGIGSWKGWQAEVKRENSYYYGHNRASDGLRQQDFTMNSPRRLASEVKKNASVELAGTAIRSYAFCDKPSTADVYIEGDYDGIQRENISVEVVTAGGASELQVEIVPPSGISFPRHLRIKELFAEASSVRVRKLSATKLTVEIKKACDGPWAALAAPPRRKATKEE